MRRQATREQVELHGESTGPALTNPLDFTLQFTVELGKLPHQLLVTIVEPVFLLELAAPVLPHRLDISIALGLGISGNPLPQIP